MKIFGLFRGFPGLGRVMSGVSLLQMLKNNGHEVMAYSYLQGNSILEEYGIKKIIEQQPSLQHIMVIGLNPISDVAGTLFDAIEMEKPDLIIVDGEPLLISTLRMFYPREKILTLLNPSDLYNPALPKSSILFYHHHYLAAGHAIVHGFNVKENVMLENEMGCNINTINTILREEIFDSKLSTKGNKIVGILGGGCSNSSQSFFESTVEMGKKIIDVATFFKKEKFVIYCNDRKIYNRLSEYNSLKNVKIVSEYTSPVKIYSDAKAIICRAGRNTISEILYLNIPSILFSTNGDFRSKEQNDNIESVCKMRNGRINRVGINESSSILVKKIEQILNSSDDVPTFEPGNEIAMEIIYRIVGEK